MRTERLITIWFIQLPVFKTVWRKVNSNRTWKNKSTVMKMRESKVRWLTTTGGSGSSTIDGLDAAALLWVFRRRVRVLEWRVAPLLIFSSFSSAELLQDEPFGVVLADDEELTMVELEHQSFQARRVVGPITGSSRSLFWSDELLEEVSELIEALLSSLLALRTPGVSSS